MKLSIREKIKMTGVLLLLCAALFGCSRDKNQSQTAETPTETEQVVGKLENAESVETPIAEETAEQREQREKASAQKELADAALQSFLKMEAELTVFFPARAARQANNASSDSAVPVSLETANQNNDSPRRIQGESTERQPRRRQGESTEREPSSDRTQRENQPPVPDFIRRDRPLAEDFRKAQAAYDKAAALFEQKSYDQAYTEFLAAAESFSGLRGEFERQKPALEALQSVRATVAENYQQEQDAFLDRSRSYNNTYNAELVELSRSAMQAFNKRDYAKTIEYCAAIPEKAAQSTAYRAEKAASINKENANALESAKEKLEWAASINAPSVYPAAYQQADETYKAALSATEMKDWDNALFECGRAVMAVMDIERAWRADEELKATAAAAKAAEAEAERKKAEAATAAADKKKAEEAALAAKKAADEKKKADEAAAKAAADKKASDTATASLASAKKRIDGVSNPDRQTYPTQYKTAADAYAEAVKAQLAKDWNAVNANVKKANDAVDQINKAVAAAAEAQRKAEEAAKNAAKYKIGDKGPAGGIVFYDKGKSADGWRYLEAAPEDVSFTINGSQIDRFNCPSLDGTGMKLGEGKQNTQAFLDFIEERGGRGDRITYGADACAEWIYGGYQDWFLPSARELDLLYKNLAAKGLGNFKMGDSWYGSSSILSPDYASYSYNTRMSDGYVHGWCNPTYYVRAVRSFDE